MDMTAKDIVEVTLGLVGKDGRAFPTQREIRKACGDTGRFKRMDQALQTVQLARGVVQPTQVMLDKDFAAVLATMSVPTVAPTFDTVTGIPEAALAKFREGVVLLGAHTERQQSDMLSLRAKEQGSWKDSALNLRRQVNALTEALDEASRSARETEQQHVAAVSQLREQRGVLEKEVEFLRAARSDVERRLGQLESDLLEERTAMAAEVARRHTAEMRVAALEATNDTRAAMEQKAAAPTPDIRPRRERKTKAA